MIVYHEQFLRHRQADPFHPESPERLEAIVARLKDEGLWNGVQTPQPAPFEDLARVHHRDYLTRLQGFGQGYWDPDAYVGPETYEIARLAAGGALAAAEWTWSRHQPALALLRPPGHHATPCQAMGFCYLNNIAIAAAHLAAQGRGPIAIVDLDVHHGNGTQDIFYADDRVLFISLHQWPLYPGTGTAEETGAGRGRGLTVNLPLPPGSGDGTYRLAFERVVGPILARFRPAMILVSLGTDAHERDPLANMTLTSAGLLDLVDRVSRAAEKLSEGRWACFLEGGYHLGSLAEVMAGVAGFMQGRAVTPQATESRDPQGHGALAVERVRKLQKAFWDI